MIAGHLALFIDDRARERSSDPLAERVRTAAAACQISFQRIFIESADNLAGTMSAAPLVVLLAPDVTPLFATARLARSLWPGALIIFLAPALRLLVLQNELTVRGLFGDLYRMQDADSARLADELADHMAAAVRRHARSATVEAINTHLLRQIPQPTNVRRLLQSNQYLASVLLNAPDGIVFLDAQGTINLWNDGAMAMFGYDEDATVGRSLDFLSCPGGAGDTPTLLSVLAEVMDGHAVMRRDVSLCNAVGQRVDVGVTLAEIGDERGRRLGFALFMRDVTARNRYQESLAAEHERLLVTLRSIGDGVITTDTAGRVTLLNRVAETLCGWPLADALGQPLSRVFRVVHERTLEPREDPVSQVLRTNAVIELANHTALIARDGSRRLIADSGAPIRDAAGRLIGVVLVFRDVTEKQRIEDALLRARQLEAIGFLAGGIAHDFNNILTALFGNISLMRLHVPPDSPMRALLEQADQAFYRARDLTQQLLTFAKGGAPLKKTGSLRALIEDTARFLLHGTKTVTSFTFPDDLWSAEFDPGQMSQALSNILLNAIQVMPAGGTITVGGSNIRLRANEVPPLKEGPYVRLFIEDEGPGIPETDRERVFHPYFTTKESGTGLGLATAYSVVQRHGGHIGIGDSRRGARFEIYLPAADTHSTSAADERPARGEPDGGRGYVVIMDDEEPVRTVCADILGHLGYEVELVADGESLVSLYGKRFAEGRRPDAVIVDLTVPGGMDGREAARRILAIDRDARLLVSSGYCNDPVMSAYRDHGFVGVIAKPYDVRELAANLARVMRASHDKT
ncbi:PAS domain S-box protein [Acidiferrobacter thiooxydans]|uniref:hybrid sensor histidine kinase/response regulator n=1 Tax=Acidiferrobacter thiooxydans TaxID=163359 RepID=UPI0011470A99|nr:PAS domain S-box protein [Acidiferrobacter thiooxydans]UEO00392.1 PAS domain S-box protein [Acidiferrobacter thiooxydans]